MCVWLCLTWLCLCIVWFGLVAYYYGCRTLRFQDDIHNTIKRGTNPVWMLRGMVLSLIIFFDQTLYILEMTVYNIQTSLQYVKQKKDCCGRIELNIPKSITWIIMRFLKMKPLANRNDINHSLSYVLRPKFRYQYSCIIKHQRPNTIIYCSIPIQNDKRIAHIWRI